jgi:hypothetical protein
MDTAFTITIPETSIITTIGASTIPDTITIASITALIIDTIAGIS